MDGCSCASPPSPRRHRLNCPFLHIQVCWWLCSACAGLLSTWTAWCGHTLTTSHSPVSTSSPGCASTWAPQSTPSSTTLCPPASGRCLLTSPAAPRGSPLAPAWRWPNAAFWASNHTPLPSWFHPILQEANLFTRTSRAQCWGAASRPWVVSQFHQTVQWLPRPQI